MWAADLQRFSALDILILVIYYFQICCILLHCISVVRHCPTCVGRLQAFALPPAPLRGLNVQPLTPGLMSPSDTSKIKSKYLIAKVSHCHQQTLNPFLWASPGSCQVAPAPSKPVLFQHKCACPSKLRPVYAPAFIWASRCLWSQWQLRAVKPKGQLQQAVGISYWELLESQPCTYSNTWVQRDSSHHVSEFPYNTGLETSESSRIKVTRLQYFHHQQ